MRRIRNGIVALVLCLFMTACGDTGTGEEVVFDIDNVLGKRLGEVTISQELVPGVGIFPNRFDIYKNGAIYTGGYATSDLSSIPLYVEYKREIYPVVGIEELYTDDNIGNLPGHIKYILGEKGFSVGYTETTLVIPDTVEYIENCVPVRNMTWVEFPENYYGGENWYGTSFGPDYIDPVIIPEGVKNITNLFNGSISIPSVTLPNTLEVIRGNTFVGCESLEVLRITGDLKEIEYGNFEGCKIKKLELAGGKTTDVVFEYMLENPEYWGNLEAITVEYPDYSENGSKDYEKSLRKNQQYIRDILEIFDNVAIQVYGPLEVLELYKDSIPEVAVVSNDISERETEMASDQGTQDTEINSSVVKLSERPTQYIENYKVLEHINDGLILYVPSEDNTTLKCVSWDRGELADRYIVEELIARGILPSGLGIEASINSTPKYIYVGKTIEEYLCTLTPEQEDMVMASLVCSIGANHGQREVTVYSGATRELLVTNNYQYDVPVSPDYYYELFQGTVGEDIQGIGGTDNVELGNGPELEDQIIAMARVEEVLIEGLDTHAWESMEFSAAGVTGTVGMMTQSDMVWEPAGWVNVHYTEWTNSYQQYEENVFSALSFYTSVNGSGENAMVAAVTYNGDAEKVPLHLPGNITQNSTALDVRTVYGTPDYVSPNDYYYFSDDYTKALHIMFENETNAAKIIGFELVDTLQIFDYTGNPENKIEAVANYLKEQLSDAYGTNQCKYIDEDVTLSTFYTKVDSNYNLCRVKIR